MESLVDAYEKVAAEEEQGMLKLAEEEAAGRIMARGFWDELTKVAGQGFSLPPKQEMALPAGRLSPVTGKRGPAPAPARTPTSNVTVGKATRIRSTPKSVVTVGKAKQLPMKSSLGAMAAAPVTKK